MKLLASWTVFVIVVVGGLLYGLYDDWTRQHAPPSYPSKLVVVDRAYHPPTWRKIITKSGKLQSAQTTPSYIAICIDSAGVEWNVELTGKEFFATHIGDTLGTR